MRTLYSVAGIIFALDQWTKFLALRYLKPDSTRPVIENIFHLSLIENTGIAFGFFQGHPHFWSLIITLSVLCLILGSYFFRHQLMASRLSYGFILGGAIGNWLDRIRLNHVIDFIDLRIWPVFNVADSSITIGVVLLIGLALKGR